MFTKLEIESSFERKTHLGVVGRQDLTSYEIIEGLMRQAIFNHEEEKIWWFAYELIGWHMLDGKRYFLSYKAATRVSEMSGDKMDLVESRETEGKLNLYRLKGVHQHER